MPAAVDPDLQRLLEDYCAAYNAGETDKVLAHLAEDALTLSPDQAPVRGREAHRKYFEAGFAREPKRMLTLTSIRSQGFGDLLYDAGEWANTVGESPGSPKSPGSRSSSGYYLTVFRREKNVWKVLATTFNVKQ
jgi:ketosteroid isomerase-like protein